MTMEPAYRNGQKVRLIVHLVDTARAGDIVETADICEGGDLSLRMGNTLVHGVPTSDVEPVDR